MNIELANRLLQYRKNSGLSQEELAEKLGISRQSISKWERAEASPDTDNIIELSLTQAETFLFNNFNKIDIQLRVVTNSNDVLSSDIYSDTVDECLDKEVL